MAQQYFYDGQIRRFLLQFTRLLSNFECEFGRDSEGNATYIRIPVKHGDASKNASVILQENSASNIPCAPLFTFHITDLSYDRPNVQHPSFVSKKQVSQRQWQESTQSYATVQGSSFTVEKPMPVPYILGINLDIWTTSIEQKLQIIEQLAPLFNPSLEVQSTDNYLDWTSLSVINLKSTNWSSRSVPDSSGDSIDIATYKFEIPIWLSPPSRVTKQGVIHSIVTNMFDDSGDLTNSIADDDILLGTRMHISPHGYQLLYIDDQLQLLRQSVPANGLTMDDPEYENVNWRPVIEEYGSLRNGISLVYLTIEEGVEIYGSVSYHPTDDNILLFTLDGDSLPNDTIEPVQAVINPLTAGPDEGLAPARLGQRYLLSEHMSNIVTDDIKKSWFGENNERLDANTNDIIEYDGTKWFIAFDYSMATNPVEFVTNITSSQQYKWIDGAWRKSQEGMYDGGTWRIVL